MPPHWCYGQSVLASSETSPDSGGFAREGCFAFRGEARWKSWLDNSAQSIFPQAAFVSQNRRDPPSLGDFFPRPFPSGLHQSKLCQPQTSPRHRGGLSPAPSGRPTLALPVPEPCCLPNCYSPPPARSRAHTEVGDPSLARRQSDRNAHKAGESQKLLPMTSSVDSLSPQQRPPHAAQGKR